MASLISAACFMFLVSHLGLIRAASDGYEWGYGDTVSADARHEHWGEHVPACAGPKQSPIDIVSTKYDEKLKNDPFAFQGYNSPSDAGVFSFGNSGHNVGVGIVGGYENFTVSGGGLKGDYHLIGFHFHWGAENSHGSEHFIGGKQASAELHFVNHHTDHADVSAALDHPDGLAVLGVLLEVGDTDNAAYAPLTSQLPNLPYKDSPKISLPPMTLTDLMPNNRASFYRYEGSLTTPPCTQAVVWTVFSESVKISQAQMDAFRTDIYYSAMADQDHNKTLTDNFRLPEPINGRTVYVSQTSLVVDDDDGASNSLTPATLCTLLLAVIALFTVL